MPIVSKSTRNTLRTMSGRFWTLPVMSTAASYHVAAGTAILTGLGAGSAVPGVGVQFTRTPQSLFFTPALTGTVGFLLTGLNQFGETVSEPISLTTTTAKQTALCYSKILSLIITTSVTAADAINIGYSVVNPRVPMLGKLAAAGSVLAVNDLNQTTKASQPTVKATTANPAVDSGSNYNIASLGTGAEAYNVLLTGTLIFPTIGMAGVTMYLDPNDSGL